MTAVMRGGKRRGEMCQNQTHRYFHDPAPPFTRRCIECEEAWLDYLADWHKRYKQRKSAERKGMAA